MYQALYRKYRPSTFDEMVGQDHITEILKNQCAKGKNSHAYLFCGTRGTGKTSAAKILAKALNCQNTIDGNPCGQCPSCRDFAASNAIDVLELDAASNNGVDDIRRLCDELMYPPAVLKKRVYIIDEVHMLSSGAFNALLKTLEEPPEYVVFILATTELNKIPPTILSRCQRFEFRHISPETIKNRLLYVTGKENIAINEDAAMLLANLADGAMRDALSLLESCLAAAYGGVIDVETVERQIGLSNNETGLALMKCAVKSDIAGALKIISDVNSSAKDLTSFLDDLSYLVRDLIYVKASGTNASLNERFVYTSAQRAELEAVSAAAGTDMLFAAADIIDEAKSRISRTSMNKRLLTEFAVIHLCNITVMEGENGLKVRLSALEAKSGEMKVNADEKRIEAMEKRIEALENGERIAVKTESIDKRIHMLEEAAARIANEERQKKQPEPQQPVQVVKVASDTEPIKRRLAELEKRLETLETTAVKPKKAASDNGGDDEDEDDGGFGLFSMI